MTDGQFDSAVVEALALAYALHIACEMHTRAEGFTGALVVVDNTNVVAGLLAGYDPPRRLQDAIAHIRRNASKVLRAGWSIRVIHKGVYSYSKKWKPDGLARAARQMRLAWKPSKDPLCPVNFENPVLGNFQGISSSSGGLDPTVLFAFDMTAE